MREQMVLDEKLIGVELSASKKQFPWPVNDPTEKKSKENEDDNESNDEMSALQKIFVLQSAVLGVGAKADQRNLVQLTIKDSANEKTILDQPIFSLSLNRNDSISGFNLRILLTETTEVTFKLVEGDGPVHLITSKLLEPPFDLGNYTSDDDEDDEHLETMSLSSEDELLQSAGDRKTQLKSLKKSKKPTNVPTQNKNHHAESSELQQQKKKRKKDE